ncbi:hypothetical protein F5890DRAFT_1496793 [Lentinula detonsa]|uniref:Uncharacterized protein n=1 Tax=Lentinula detonsa TaxID=2804962 RepID=A0AA38UX22_9AGAR|nr:hypothetical protein F5890DRAFT_1496793 [Lentinula detonsa]
MAEPLSEADLRQRAQAFFARISAPGRVPELKLQPDANQTSQLSTRSPSPYDYHMPHELQPRSLIFSPDNMETAQAMILRSSSLWMLPGMACLGVMDLRVTNENDIQSAQRQVYNIVCQLATLVLFPVTEKQLTQLGYWKLLVPRSSINTAPIADILLGVTSAAEIQDAYSRIQRYQDSDCDSLLDLRSSVFTEAAEPFLRTIFSEECKKLALGNPLGYITLLLLVQLSEKKQLPIPHGIWLKPNCRNCSAFGTSHAVLELREDPSFMPDPFVFPLPMDQNPRPPLGETDYRESHTLNPDILVEIKRVLGLWKKDGGGTKAQAQDSNTAVDDTTTSVDERNLNFRKSVQRSLSKLLPQIPPLGEFGIGLCTRYYALGNPCTLNVHSGIFLPSRLMSDDEPTIASFNSSGLGWSTTT